MDAIWPEVFQTGMLSTDGYNLTRDRAIACADGLCGWGNCHAGVPIPEKFGEGMAAIGRYLGINPLPENLHQYADQILKELDGEEANHG